MYSERKRPETAVVWEAAFPLLFWLFRRTGKIRGYFIKFSHIYNENYGMISWYFGKNKNIQGRVL